jgi:CBS-domain-containing membrane protein
LLDIFQKQNIRSLPVLDAEGRYLGIFGLRHILMGLLPMAVQMKNGLENLDFIEGASPGISKRLKKLYNVKVSDLLDPEAITVEPDTQTWEALRVMAYHGSPVALVEKETQKFRGLISRQTLLAELQQQVEDLDK